MSARRAHGRRAVGRLRAGVVLLAGVSGLVALSSLAPRPRQTEATVRDASAIAPTSAQSSTWVCAGLRAGSRSTVTLENRGAGAVTGSMTILGARRILHTQPIGVAGRSRATLSVVLPRSANYVAALVALHGGGVLVSEALHWNGLVASAPCGSSTTTTAYLADAVSTRHTSSVVTVVNPSTVAPAVVSITALTPHGVDEPAPLQGIVVPPLRSVAVDLASSVLDQAVFAAQVDALSGRVVVAEDELGWGRNRILTILPGHPALSSANVLPDEVLHAGQGQLLTVTNFDAAPATVQLQVTLPSGILTPTSITVPGRTIVGEPLTALPGVPQDFPFVVRATARPGAIAIARTDQVWDGLALWRSAEVGVALDAATSTAVLGSPSTASGIQRWHVLVVTNVAGRPITVRTAVVGRGSSLPAGSALRLGVGQVVVLGSGPAVAAGNRGAMVVVEATGPVVVAGRPIPQLQPTGESVSGVPAD